MLNEILHANQSFVARRNRIGQWNPVVSHVHGNYSRECSTLRNDRRARMFGFLLRRSNYKGQWNAVNVVDHPEAVWPLESHSVMAGNVCQFALCRLSRFAT